MAIAMSNPGPTQASINPISTPYFSIQLLVDYHVRYHTTNNVGRSIQPHSESEDLKKLLLQVDQVREQGADWDDQEGQVVSQETADHAKRLLLTVAQRAEQGGWTWANSAVSATPEGGIHLSWLVSGNRVALTVFAPVTPTTCLSKLQGTSSRRELLSDGSTVERVLQAFQASTPSLSITDPQL